MKLLSWWRTVSLLGLVLCPSVTAVAQDAVAAEHPLHELASLQGSWSGEIDGTFGPATGQRQYRFIIGNRFLLMMHDRDQQQAASGSDIHEEWSIFSFDTERDMIVLREFLVEGLVNRYTCELESRPT
ncbi:MAG: hypothetical protein JSW51_12705, partial [Gemmatimonadota bacterium]